MLKQLAIKNLTVFPRIEPLNFCKGLNVLIGENGTGKTHLLKVGYLACQLWHLEIKDKNTVSKSAVEKQIAERLLKLFKADKIGNLSSATGNNRTQILASVEGTIPTISFGMPGEAVCKPLTDQIDWAFHFSNRAESNVMMDELPEHLTANAHYGRAVYLPSKEMLSFFEGFIALYQTHALAFDETYYDLAIHLSIPALNEQPPLVQKLLQSLSDAVGGKVLLEGGRFYVTEGKKQREIALVAEGLRKLATIMQLLVNGRLTKGGTLFWDEPEANLNPRLIRLVAYVIHALALNGIQVFIATHSYFLLKELELLARKEPLQQRHFSLIKDSGLVDRVEQVEALADLEHLLALEEELAQYDRQMELHHADF